MHSAYGPHNALLIEIPRMLGRKTIVFTPDYVTDSERKIYYRDATKISYSAERNSVNFIPYGQYYSFIVGSADQEIRISMGTTLYIGNARREAIWQKLAGMASNAIQPHIIDKLMHRIFVNVEAVRIGGLELTRDGYSCRKLFGGREHLRWTETMHAPTMEDGRVNLWRNNKGRRALFTTIDMSTPNAVVLPALMKACANAAYEKSSPQDDPLNRLYRGSDWRHRLEISFTEAIRGTTKYVDAPGGATLEVVIPPGVDDGHTLQVPGRVPPGGGKPRDALIEIAVKPHPSFTRKGLDIWSDVRITAHDAVSGATIEVPTLDGYAKVRVPEGAVSGQILRLRGNGVICARSRAIGHQLIRLAVGEDAAQAPPAGEQQSDALETEFKSVFFSRTSADRERIISYWMKAKSVDRAEAMKLAIEDWQKDNYRTG
jgi:hypothetical protein